MKIVQLVQTLDIGGLERLAIDLALQQKIEGHEPSLYCTRHSGLLARQAEAAGVPVHVFGKRDGFSPRLIGQLVSKLRKHRPDVLHTHNALVLHYGIVAARLARVPVVVNTQHSGTLTSDPRLGRLWSRMVPWTSAVVFMSEGARDHFVGKGGISRRNTRVIYNGIDLDRFGRRLVPPGADPTHFRFGTVGRLWPEKDQVTLTRAFALVSRELPGSELHILGEGPCRRQIEQTAASAGIAQRVVLHGAGLDVAGFLADLDLFVLSSLREGMPLALIEAMAAGLPIASVRLAGLTEIAPENDVAEFCPTGQPEALAHLMLRMARRPDLAAMGETARQVAQKFGIQETWRQYRELFEELIPTRQRLLRPNVMGV
jgi:glycosyltransferase involved in cell wall biosynthesis